jgi:hypothetical protein
MIDLQLVKATLLGRRYTADAVPQLDGPGVYALFLAEPAGLGEIRIDPSGLLYVGMTESSLDIVIISLTSIAGSPHPDAHLVRS